MGTVHEEAARKTMRRWLGTPEGAQLLHLVYTGVTSRWSDDYLAMIGQHYIHSQRGTWPAEQVAAFGIVHHRIEQGIVGRIPIRTGGTPHRDSRRELNAALLSQTPYPFVAELDMNQNGADSDGVLTWTEPIEVQVATGETGPVGDGTERAILRDAVIRPGSVPLEVGDSLPSRTAMHLTEDRAVARWPYGSEWIWLLVDMDIYKLRDGDPQHFVASDHGHPAEHAS